MIWSPFFFFCGHISFDGPSWCCMSDTMYCTIPLQFISLHCHNWLSIFNKLRGTTDIWDGFYPIPSNIRGLSAMRFFLTTLTRLKIQGKPPEGHCPCLTPVQSFRNPIDMSNANPFMVLYAPDARQWALLSFDCSA